MYDFSAFSDKMQLQPLYGDRRYTTQTSDILHSQIFHARATLYHQPFLTFETS